MLYKNSNPLLQKAFLYHEIEQVCQNFLSKYEIEATLQIKPTTKKIDIWFLVSSSSEASAILMDQESLKTMLREYLETKKLVDPGVEFNIRAKVR